MVDFVNPAIINEWNKTDSAIFTKNLKMVFGSFVEFLKKVKSEGRKNSEEIKEWIQHTDEGGNSTITMLLNWVNGYNHFEEEFLSFL